MKAFFFFLLTQQTWMIKSWKKGKNWKACSYLEKVILLLIYIVHFSALSSSSSWVHCNLYICWWNLVLVEYGHPYWESWNQSISDECQ